MSMLWAPENHIYVNMGNRRILYLWTKIDQKVKMWCFVSARSLHLLLLAFFTPLHIVFLTNLGLLTTTNSPIYKPWAYISLLKSFRGAYKGRGLYPTEVIAGIEKALPHKVQQCWSKYIVISITQGSQNHQRCSYILWWFASRAEEIL